MWGIQLRDNEIMKYAILRTQKLKSATTVRRSMMHAFREQETPNADESRTPDNTHIGAQNVREGMEKLQAKLPEKVRKNGVLCVEYLMTASPEAMASKSKAEQDAFFNDSLQWLRDKHGAENVLYAGIHRDEKTPHMYAYVVPIDPKGKLNCRHFLGGAKALSAMQTDFVEKVGCKHGLERGIEGSKAKHQRVKRFYAEIQKEPQLPTIDPESLKPKSFKEGFFGRLGLPTHKENEIGIAERLNAEIKKAVLPAFEMASQSRIEARRAHEIEKTAKDLGVENERLKKAVKDFFGGLSDQSKEKLAAFNLELRAKQAEDKKLNAQEKKNKDQGMER